MLAQNLSLPNQSEKENQARKCHQVALFYVSLQSLFNVHLIKQIFNEYYAVGAELGNHRSCLI